MDINAVDTFAKQLVKEAGERIKKSFSNVLNIETKSHANDLVTNMDREIEQYFIHKLKGHFPEHRVLGEEGVGSNPKELSGVVWIIDPIDGTMNFVHQQRNFAISIGIYEDGVGKIGLIYDVVHDELYHAKKGEGAFLNDKQLSPLSDVKVEEAVIGLNSTWVTQNRRIDRNILSPLVKAVRGTRSYGSAAIEMAYVAAGRLDSYITLRLSPWDFAAGIILVEEVGGVCTTLKGEKLNLLGENSVFIANGSFHEKVLKDFLNNGNW
jgi:myo-inositol-1(or 4)-monophosphatase